MTSPAAPVATAALTVVAGATAATATPSASSALAAALALARANAPPRSFASTSHDEFSAKAQKKATARPQHTKGPVVATTASADGAVAKAGASTSATPAAASAAGPTAKAPAAASSARSTIYRSPLTSRPLLRTLNAVLHSLVGLFVRVDLKNECSVRGRLDEIDKAGNMLMSACSCDRPSRGPHLPPPPTKTDSMFLPGRGVRFVHLPDRVDVVGLLRRWESGQDDRLLMYKRRKRMGKYTTREEQERQIDAKQAKLAKEIEKENAAASALQHDSSTPEPDAKRQKTA